MGKALTLETPVDTSKALSNWIITLLVPSFVDLPAHVQGQWGSTWGESTATGIAELKAALVGRKSGEPIYLQNNVTYIDKLNDGHSSQQPAGWIESVTNIAWESSKDKWPTL